MTTNSMLGKNGALYPMLVLAAVSVIVFSAFGVAMVTGLLSAEPARTQAQSVAAATDAGQYKPCAYCGVVESISPVEDQGNAGSGPEKIMTLRYKVRLRMQDGTYRASYQSSAPGFAIGDQVKVVNGQIVAQR